MSGILKRTVFTSQLPVTSGEKNGKSVYRFTDFAVCTTGVGSCVEPFNWHDNHALNGAMPAEIDPTDMIRRVDKIGSHSPTGELELFNDDGTVLHAFSSWVRTGP